MAEQEMKAAEETYSGFISLFKVGSIITAIVRHDEVVVPRGDTVPQVDDMLLITTRRDGDPVARCTRWARPEG